jgi:Family of unknown function (DUF6519)
MPSDRSRPSDSIADAFTGVSLQQGRVLLDRDFNAERDIVDQRERAVTRDVVGPCGTPDDGFAIRAPLYRRPLTEIRNANSTSFRLPLSPPSDAYNLLIGPGTMYVGGLRVEFPPEVGGTAMHYGYWNQPDWLQPDPPAAPATEIVWLQLDEQEVSATEDPNLLEVALGGPDTTQRLRLMRTVRRAAVTANACAPAWAALLSQWQSNGIGFDGPRMRRLPTATMQVAFTQPLSTANPCDPAATGGYLGAENQLIRVKWVPPQAGAVAGTLLWGYDNASYLYRCTPDQTGQRLSVARQPPDAYHFPGTGQYVEVLRTTALLGTGAAAEAEDGSGLLPRCIAEDTGFVTTLAAAYDPTSADNALVLSMPLPPAYETSAEPLFVRIWQGGGAMGADGGTLVLQDPVANASTGLTVTITVPAGSAIAPGAYWMMALRPGTPQTIWPAALLDAPQPADGPRSWACPLAVVEWPLGAFGPVVHDCRVPFVSLTELTARPAGCCDVSLTLAEITTDRTVQSAVNGMTGPSTLCLGPGTYYLQAPLRIGAAQAGLTIVAENGATLMAAPGTEAGFGDGLVVVAGAIGVTLRGLTLVPPAVPVASDLFAELPNLARIALPAMRDPLTELIRLTIAAGAAPLTMIGVRAAGCPSLTVAQCAVTFTAPASAAAPQFGMGLLASGTCTGLTVRGCNFDASAMPPSQTPALRQREGFLGSSGFVVPQSQVGVQGAGIQGAIGILASPRAEQFLAPQQIVPLRFGAGPNLLTGARTSGGLLRINPALSSGRVIVASGAANAIIDPTVFRNDPQDVFTTVPDFSGCTIEDNIFDSMIVAVSAFGMLAPTRVVGNTVVNSSAGIWLRPIEQARFSFITTGEAMPAVADDSMWLKLVLLQQETFLTWLLGLLLPLPAGATSGAFAATAGGGTVHVTGNAVAALAGAAGGVAEDGMPALALVTGVFTSAVDTGPGFVVADNRLQACAPLPYPAAVLAISGRLAATGNLISNAQPASPPTSVSLMIYPDNNGGLLKGDLPATRICVTGNVLEGVSNLSLLIRPDGANLPAPFNTWAPFNANA